MSVTIHERTLLPSTSGSGNLKRRLDVVVTIELDRHVDRHLHGCAFRFAAVAGRQHATSCLVSSLPS